MTKDGCGVQRRDDSELVVDDEQLNGRRRPMAWTKRATTENACVTIFSEMQIWSLNLGFSVIKDIVAVGNKPPLNRHYIVAVKY